MLFPYETWLAAICRCILQRIIVRYRHAFTKGPLINREHVGSYHHHNRGAGRVDSDPDRTEPAIEAQTAPRVSQLLQGLIPPMAALPWS